MDSISETRLAAVHPALAAAIHAVAQIMSAEGVELRVVQGLRTVAEQDALFAEGRTEPGNKVTWARGGQSMHNYGLAVDLVPGIRGVSSWQPNWNENHPDFQRMITLCEAQGLVAGARWVKVDCDHFQLGTIPVSPTPDMLACLDQGGCKSVWARFLPTTSGNGTTTA